MLFALAASLVLSAAPKLDARLVGTWFAGGERFITLDANGTGSMEEGKVKWTADGKTLTVTDDEGETDRGTYVIEGDAMTLTLGGFPLQLTRGGKTGKVGPKTQPREPPEAAPPQRQAAGTDQLSQLLLSSAWCSFSYNKTTGASSQSRVQFRRDGSWSSGSRAETYNSGPNGTVAGQSDSGDGGQWQVKGGVLFMSEGAGPLQPVQPFSVTANSNGAPIINADGREYMRCN